MPKQSSNRFAESSSPLRFPAHGGVSWRNDSLALYFAILVFCLHALFAGRYDVFRDELYFIVCGRHPAFGYADQPPVVPLLAAGLYGLARPPRWTPTASPTACRRH